MQGEDAQPGIETARDEGQRFRFGGEPHPVGSRGEGRRGIDLDQMLDAAAFAAYASEPTIPATEVERHRKAAVDILEPVEQPFRRFGEEKIETDAPHRVVSPQPHGAAVEDDDAIGGRRLHGFYMAIAAEPGKAWRMTDRIAAARLTTPKGRAVIGRCPRSPFRGAGCAARPPASSICCCRRAASAAARPSVPRASCVRRAGGRSPFSARRIAPVAACPFPITRATGPPAAPASPTGPLTTLAAPSSATTMPDAGLGSPSSNATRRLARPPMVARSLRPAP